MPDERTYLSKQMHILAEGGHPDAEELRRLGSAFDAATMGYYADPQTVTVKQFMGAWARASRLFNESKEDSHAG